MNIIWHLAPLVYVLMLVIAVVFVLSTTLAFITVYLLIELWKLKFKLEFERKHNENS